MSQTDWEQPPRHIIGTGAVILLHGIEFTEATFGGCSWQVQVGGHEFDRQSAEAAAARFIDSLRSR